VANTVAQIKGSLHPDEQVIIGAHLDSWDLGEGAVDNGTGAMAVLEAARLLKSLGWTPKRTLTFVLFYGEEQGEQGSRAFVHDHAGALEKIDACLIDDVGAGRITSLSLGDQWSTGPLLAQAYRPLQETFDLDPISNEAMGGSDHDQFQLAGVPAYLAIQDAAHYGYAHHTTDDSFVLVQPEALRQQAAVLAAWMWNVSEMSQALPHAAKRPGV
jgi:Zn-dependent M28 family amino/carboxypeptidase